MNPLKHENTSRLFNSRAIHPKYMAAAAMSALVAFTSVPTEAKQPTQALHHQIHKKKQQPAMPQDFVSDKFMKLPAPSKSERGASLGMVNAAVNPVERPVPALRSHALTVFGAPKYGPNFQHFDYVNPDAPKGGTFSTAVTGSFDSLNPFIIKGEAADQLMLVYDTLMVQSTDETGSAYGLIAESVEVPEDRHSITFHLRPEAKWQDGQQVTAEDVKWSYETLRDQATPFYRYNWYDITNVDIIDARTIKFTFGHPNQRLALMTLANMPVLPKHYWEHVPNKFEFNTTTAPMGSGPYKINNSDFGRTMSFKRDPNYWAKDLPVNRGRWNFDEIKVEYFRDENTQLESFARGLYNFRQENTAQRWATAYDRMPAVRDGRILRENYPNDLPAGMQAYVFNTRRGVFKDERVREAIAILFNFEWLNRVMAHGAYTRSNSFFANSDLASEGLPKGRELEILERFRGRIPDSVFTNGDRPPVYEDSFSGAAAGTNGKVTQRQELRRAFELLKQAGYVVREGKLVDAKTGRQLQFEMVVNSDGFVRWAMPYFETIKRLGIEPSVRVIDSAQYMNRLQRFDYDMTIGVFRQPMTPGAENRNYWHSSSADQPGSANLAGIKDPVIDELVDMLQNAKNRDELRAVTQALDRVLLAGHYVVPHYHTGTFRIAYGSELKRPTENTRPRYDLGAVSDWWYDPAKINKPKAP